MWLEIAPHLGAAGYEDRDDGSFRTQIHTLISALEAIKTNAPKREMPHQRRSRLSSTK